MNDDQERLGELLREEADRFPLKPAPIDDVLRRGRRSARHRRRAAAAAMAAGSASVAVVAALLALGPITPTEPDPATPAPPATAPPRPTPSQEQRAPRTVRPYQSVDIGHGLSMALLPDGRQNYVVGPGDISGSVEQAKNDVGANLRPGTLSSGKNVDDAYVLYHGAFRMAAPPARITVGPGSGPRRTAAVLRLPDGPGWGAYYAFGEVARADAGFTVTAYDENGDVLFEQHHQSVTAP
ncbi:hypothetical protein AB0E81_03005 [Streptomyces sp. NPDC033538]|uniref:hypothetical protein n=1 Tax=Streptomyces sp. NPDC033538 TaxID=3155367 RepID=UPI0033E7BE4E